MAEKNMSAKINVEFEESASRQQLNSGEDVNTLFGKIKKFFADLKAVAFSGNYSDLNDTPDLSQYAKRSIYGDTAINLGRKAGTTVGANSTAEGHNTTASAYYCHAEGQDTQALGNYSHAEGYNTKAESAYDHAEGTATIASGGYSHAEGGSCEATALASHAEGYHTKATKIAEHACGQYNLSNSDTLMSVGDGTSDDSRHNAFEITKTGGKLHDKDIATTDQVSARLSSNPKIAFDTYAQVNQKILDANNTVVYEEQVRKSSDLSITRKTWRIRNPNNASSYVELWTNVSSDVATFNFTSGGTNAPSVQLLVRNKRVFADGEYMPYFISTFSGTGSAVTINDLSFTPSRVLYYAQKTGEVSVNIAKTVTNGFTATSTVKGTVYEYIVFR